MKKVKVNETGLQSSSFLTKKSKIQLKYFLGHTEIKRKLM